MGRVPFHIALTELKPGANLCQEGESMEAIKISKIDSYLTEEAAQSDIWRIRQFALSRGGLVNACFRKRLWSSLVGLENEIEIESESESEQYVSNMDQHDLVGSHQQDLISRDSGRCVIFRYNNVQNAAEKVAVKESLKYVLNATVSSDDDMHYFQGLHDIAGVMLENLDIDEDKTTSILQRVCQSHMKDATHKDFSRVQWLLDTLFLPLVESTQDYEIYNILVALSDEVIPITTIVLPWLITWLTHDVRDANVASRLVDAFLASHPLFPIYFIVAMFVHPSLRDTILEHAESDMLSVQMAIKSLPSLLMPDFGDIENHDHGGVTVQDVINVAISLMEKTPPSSILQLVNSKENKISESHAESIAMLNVPIMWAIRGSCGTPQGRCNRSSEWIESKVGPIAVQTQIACGVQRNIIEGGSTLEWRTRKAAAAREKRRCQQFCWNVINHLLCLLMSLMTQIISIAQQLWHAILVLLDCFVISFYGQLVFGVERAKHTIPCDLILRLTDSKSVEWYQDRVGAMSLNVEFCNEC